MALQSQVFEKWIRIKLTLFEDHRMHAQPYFHQLYGKGETLSVLSFWESLLNILKLHFSVSAIVLKSLTFLFPTIIYHKYLEYLGISLKESIKEILIWSFSKTLRNFFKIASSLIFSNLSGNFDEGISNISLGCSTEFSQPSTIVHDLSLE